jgi:DmsE family decaheme c-type cytochrome
MKAPPPGLLLRLLAVLTFLFLLAGAGPPAGALPERKPVQEKKPDPSKYVGADTCQACHEEVFKKFETTPHWKTMLDKRGGPTKQGCESCHGPGKDHVESGGDKSKIPLIQQLSSKKISETCLTCHQYGEEHSNFARSAHNVNDVSCLDCHSVHHAKQKQFLLTKASQNDLCYSCHQNVRPEFNKPFRHRVHENLVKCSDCHNQHGGFVTRQVRPTTAQDSNCFKCHADKAGPFLFEHAPVKTEGCMSCHAPHGSSNPRLLKRSQINLVCLECHTLSSENAGVAPSGPAHSQTQKYQACTVCHTTIHGSHTSKVFFK